MKDFKPSQIILTFMAAIVVAAALAVQIIAKSLWYVGTSLNKMLFETPENLKTVDTNSDS